MKHLLCNYFSKENRYQYVVTLTIIQQNHAFIIITFPLQCRRRAKFSKYLITFTIKFIRSSHGKQQIKTDLPWGKKILQAKSCPNVNEVKVSGEEETNLEERYVLVKQGKESHLLYILLRALNHTRLKCLVTIINIISLIHHIYEIAKWHSENKSNWNEIIFSVDKYPLAYYFQSVFQFLWFLLAINYSISYFFLKMTPFNK